jgi:hypothetical protein
MKLKNITYKNGVQKQLNIIYSSTDLKRVVIKKHTEEMEDSIWESKSIDKVIESLYSEKTSKEILESDGCIESLLLENISISFDYIHILQHIVNLNINTTTCSILGLREGQVILKQKITDNIKDDIVLFNLKYLFNFVKGFITFKDIDELYIVFDEMTITY